MIKLSKGQKLFTNINKHNFEIANFDYQNIIFLLYFWKCQIFGVIGNGTCDLMIGKLAHILYVIAT